MVGVFKQTTQFFLHLFSHIDSDCFQSQPPVGRNCVSLHLIQIRRDLCPVCLWTRTHRSQHLHSSRDTQNGEDHSSRTGLPPSQTLPHSLPTEILASFANGSKRAPPGEIFHRSLAVGVRRKCIATVQESCRSFHHLHDETPWFHPEKRLDEKANLSHGLFPNWAFRERQSSSEPHPNEAQHRQSCSDQREVHQECSNWRCSDSVERN